MAKRSEKCVLCETLFRAFRRPKICDFGLDACDRPPIRKKMEGGITKYINVFCPSGQPAAVSICSRQIDHTLDLGSSSLHDNNKGPSKWMTLYYWRRGRDWLGPSVAFALWAAFGCPKLIQLIWSNPRYAINVYTLSRCAPSPFCMEQNWTHRVRP